MSSDSGDQTWSLDWVDGLVEAIRPHVFLREVDDLLILLPNQSYKLNPAGRRLLAPMLAGKTLAEVLGHRTPPEPVARDLCQFFQGVAAMVNGCLGEGRDRPEVETIPYQRPFHQLPILSEIALTYRCNLVCRFCYAGCPQQNTVGEMSTAQVKVVLQRIRQEAQVPSVSFTGGEPTLRADLPELVEAAVALGMRVNLISNGQLLTPALARRLRDSGLASAQLSLEGPDAATHDALTGVPGSFQATLAAVAAAREAGLAVHTNTTLTGANLREAVRLPALAKALGLTRLSMNLVIPSPGIKERAPELLLPYSAIGPEVLKIRETARGVDIRFLWYSPTPYCLFNPIAHNLGNKGCAACDGLLSVDPLGRIIPCSSFFEPQGSLLERPFAEVWGTKSAAAIRNKERAPAGCRTCGQFELCEGACPLYWAVCGCGELTAPSPRPSPPGKAGGEREVRIPPSSGNIAHPSAAGGEGVAQSRLLGRNSASVAIPAPTPMGKEEHSAGPPVQAEGGAHPEPVTRGGA